MEKIRQMLVPTELDNGMVRINDRPHTRDIEALSSACNGPITASYYFLCKYFDIPLDSVTLLTEIAKMQDTDEDSKTFGCSRWYREEPAIVDSNGAFFVYLPIVEAFLFCGEKIGAAEREIILPVLNRATIWFAKQCREHGYFYPNKIMSDGALLLALSEIGSDDNIQKLAHDFWYSWVEYTEKYGWGWGENTSKIYTKVMISALDVALSCLKKTDELYEKLFRLRGNLMDYRAYHGEEYEFVPSIRTYNFKGLALTSSTHGSAMLSAAYPQLANDLASKLAPQYTPEPYDESFHKEHIFGKSCAFTYKGKSIRLGTVNKFPVMPGCYQNEEWGLGWQSMPVSVLAVNHETSFLRFVTECEGKKRTHPAVDKHSAYLDTKIFEGENIPDMFTICDQKDNTAVVVRTISHIANKCSYIADEWYFQHFDGEIRNHNGWFIMDYGDCVHCVMPLNGEAEISRKDKKLQITQVLYRGEDTLFMGRFFSTAWAVAVFDGNADIESKLDSLGAEYSEIKDLYYSRPVAKPFKIKCGEAELCFDPDFSCEWR